MAEQSLISRSSQPSEQVATHEMLDASNALITWVGCHFLIIPLFSPVLFDWGGK